jgi:hypothetical protein
MRRFPVRIAFQSAVGMICLVLLHQNHALAQLRVTANGAYTIGFDSTIAGVCSGSYTGAGFQPLPTAGQLDSDAWCIHWSPTSSLTYGGTQTTFPYAQGQAVNTPVTDGGFYAFNGGNITTGIALGIQPDGNGFNAPGDDLTLRIRNDTGHFITDFDASYLLYVRNDQDRGTKFNFSYSADDLNYTIVQTLNYTSPPARDTNGFVNYPRAASIPSLAVPNGSYFYLRWSCSDGGGTSGLRDEFALDDITVKNFTLADGIPTRGDVNLDNSIDVADVQALAGAIMNLDAFQASHPTLTPSQVSLILNINQDSAIDNLDVQALLGLLVGSSAGGGQLEAVPEPTASDIAVCGAVLAIVARQSRRKT